MSNISLNLGGDYLTFSREQPRGPTAPKAAPTTQAKPIGAAPSQPQHSRNHKDRRRTFLKEVCSLPAGNYFFLTLATDKKSNPDLYRQPDRWKAWLKKFGGRFQYRFPTGFYFWKVEMDSDRKGVHFHLIVSTGDDTGREEFHDWATAAWRRVVRSPWDRLTDTRQLTAARIGYFFKQHKHERDAELVASLGRSASFGLVGRKNAALIRPRAYRPTEDQLQRIRALLTQATHEQAQHRFNGRVNQRHLNNIKADFCFHAFLGADLKAQIQNILEEPCRHL